MLLCARADVRRDELHVAIPVLDVIEFTDLRIVAHGGRQRAAVRHANVSAHIGIREHRGLEADDRRVHVQFDLVALRGFSRAGCHDLALGGNADKDIGGDKLAENLSVARKALETFGTPELRDVLNATGFGNHPAVIKAFYKIGQAISEDRFVTGGAKGPETDMAKRMFPSMN